MYMFLLSLPAPRVDSACLDLSMPNAVVSSYFMSSWEETRCFDFRLISIIRLFFFIFIFFVAIEVTSLGFVWEFVITALAAWAHMSDMPDMLYFMKLYNMAFPFRVTHRIAGANET